MHAWNLEIVSHQWTFLQMYDWNLEIGTSGRIHVIKVTQPYGNGLFYIPIECCLFYIVITGKNNNVQDCHKIVIVNVNVHHS